MNDFVTISKILESNLKDSSVRVYLYIYCFAGAFDYVVKLSNNELSQKLHLNIKTVVTAIEQLKKEEYLIISGRTTNRQLACNDPCLLEALKSKKIKEKNTLKRQNSESARSKLDKWFKNYMKEVIPEQRLKDIQQYIDHHKISLSKGKYEELCFTKKPQVIPNFSKQRFKLFIEISDFNITKKS